MLTDVQKDEAVSDAQEISKYAFMLSFALSFPNDKALIAHNREMLKMSTEKLLDLFIDETLPDILAAMALEGYGVSWHPTYNEYRPYEVETDGTIEWWHDPSGCGNKDFEPAVRATYDEMLRQLGP